MSESKFHNASEAFRYIKERQDAFNARFFNTKQDKCPGKGLSTNDFTNEYKNILNDLRNSNLVNAGLKDIKIKNELIVSKNNHVATIDLSGYAKKEDLPDSTLYYTKNQVDKIIEDTKNEIIKEIEAHTETLTETRDIFTVGEDTIQNKFILKYEPKGTIMMYINGIGYFSGYSYDNFDNSILWEKTAKNGGFDITDSEIVFIYKHTVKS